MKSYSYSNILITTLIILITSSINSQEDKCNYFGLSKPSLIPQEFNPEVLDLKGSFKFNVEIKNCNEIYFTTIDSQENIYYSKRNNGKWSTPKIASFSNPKYSDADPFLSKDENTIYFISKRPTHKEDRNLDWNIWSSIRENDKWLEAKPLPSPINSDNSNEYFFSISDKGNVFFSSNRKGGNGSFDIYTAKILDENKFSEPKNIGLPISTNKYEFDPYISPDESFLLFSINVKGNSSLYYSKKDSNNNWTKPQNLGDKINITRQDFAPSLSADGKFMFYSNNGKLMWVSSQILSVAKQK